MLYLLQISQGSFTDLELKNNNGTKLLIDGDTGDITGHGTLSIDNINEKTSASGVTIGSDLIVDTIKGGSTMIIDPAAHNNNTGKLVIKGDLEVQGDTTSINSTIIELSDNRIKLNAAASTDAGIDISFSDGTSKSFYYSKSDVQWKTDNTSLNIGSGTITAATLSGNAATATQLANARTIGGVLFDGTINIDLPGVNQPGNQDTTGNAATATKLANARTIGGVSFDGTNNINLPGVNQVGNQNTSGNAATATKLANARTIGGVSFDGTGNINLPGVNQVGNQNTSGNAATATKLANARTINNISFDGTQNIVIPIPDSLPDQSGNNGKLLISDGSNATWSSDISVNNIDISVNLKVNNISEKTNGSGITIDNVLIKDNTITTNGSDSKMTINNLNSNNDGTQNTYSETEINSKLSNIIWNPRSGNSYGSADYDVTPDGFSGTWENNIIGGWDIAGPVIIFLPAYNSHPDRVRIFSRSGYRDFDLENFKWISQSRISLPSGHSGNDPMGYVYSEVYNRYLIFDHGRLGREGTYAGGFIELNTDLTIFESTRYPDDNTDNDKSFLDGVLNSNNNKAYLAVYRNGGPDTGGELGIYNFQDRSISFTILTTLIDNAPPGAENSNGLYRIAYISTLDKFLITSTGWPYGGNSIDYLQLIDNESNNFSFIKRFDRQEVFNQSNTSYTWPANKSGQTQTLDIKNFTLSRHNRLPIRKMEFIEELNCVVIVGSYYGNLAYLIFLEVTNTGFGNYNFIPLGNKGTYYESAINFRWIPELKRIVLTAANQEYTFSDGPFAGVMDKYYVNSRGIDLIYNNISLNSTNCFTITASDFSTVFGYQTSPWALQGANSSHNYSFVPQWISKYGTLINLYGGLRDPITHQGSTNFYFITKPVGRMTIPYSTTTSRVFNIENNVDISGNITAIKYYGDGSQLTGIDALPDQSGNSGKLLISDGSNAIWSSDINDGLKISGAIYDNTNNKGTNGQVLQSNGTTWNWATPITSNDISNAIAGFSR